MDFKKLSSNWFWVGVVGGAALLAGAGYYLVKFLSKEEEEETSEENKDEIEKLKMEIETRNGPLDEELAVKIMAEANKQMEILYKKTYPDLEDKRRDALNDIELYENICNETFMRKDEVFQIVISSLLNKLGNLVTMNEIKQALGNMNPTALDDLAYKFEKPSFAQAYPTREMLKEAYKYYSSMFQKEIIPFKAYLSTVQNNQLRQEDHEMILLRFLIIKTRADDMLYLKYKITEQQIRFLLSEYKMREDQEIVAIQAQLRSFDEMLGDK